MSLDINHHPFAIRGTPSADTLFRTGNAIHGRDGIKGRERPYKRPRIAFKIDGHSVVYGRFDDGRIAEVFINGFEDTSAKLATLLLQRGTEIETVRKAIPDGTPIAIALDRLMAISGGPRSASYRWLQKCSRRQTLNRNRTTATWKHWAEADEGQYTSVEQFHEAAIKLGFRLVPIAGTPNCWINIAEPKKTNRRYRR